MKNSPVDVAVLKTFFEDHPDLPVKESGLRLIEVIMMLREENSYLKNQVIKAEKDLEWVQKKADEWMLKFIEASQLNQGGF